MPSADTDAPPHLLRLDFFAMVSNDTSPVPGLTGTELVEAFEGGFVASTDIYKAVGKVR